MAGSQVPLSPLWGAGAPRRRPGAERGGGGGRGAGRARGGGRGERGEREGEEGGDRGGRRGPKRRRGDGASDFFGFTNPPEGMQRGGGRQRQFISRQRVRERRPREARRDAIDADLVAGVGRRRGKREPRDDGATSRRRAAEAMMKGGEVWGGARLIAVSAARPTTPDAAGAGGVGVDGKPRSRSSFRAASVRWHPKGAKRRAKAEPIPRRRRREGG